jgi:CheY-like chemotaxis protein
MKFLVVDDVDDIRELVRRYLEQGYYNCEVFQAADGVEALVMAAKHHPDVVITDRHMPRMDGEELARILLRLHPLLPIILITADTHSVVSPGIFLAVLNKTELRTLVPVLKRQSFIPIKHQLGDSSCLSD